VEAGASLAPPDIFVEAYGGAHDDVARCVIATQDGDIVVTGYSVGSATGKNLLLARFDSQGNKLWKHVYGSLDEQDDEEGRCVVETRDGDLVLVGYTTSRGDAADFVISKFDSEGHWQWTYTWGGAAAVDERLYSVIEASDGTLWAAGFTESYTPVGRKKVVLAKIAPSGTTLACARAGKVVYDWDLSGLAVAEVFGAYPGFCVAGTIIDHRVFGFGQEILLAKFDDTPDFMWADRIGKENDGDSSETATAIVRTSDGCLALAGHLTWWDDVLPDDGGFLLKTDSDAQADWWRVALGFAHYYSRTVTSVIETYDAGLVVTGKDSSYMYDDRVVLGKFDLAGQEIWNRGHEIGDGCVGNSVAEDPSRCLVAAGSTEGYGQGAKDLLLAKYCCTGLTCLPDVGGPGFTPWSAEQDRIPLLDAEFEVPTSYWFHPFIVYPMDVTTVCSPTTHVVCPDGSGDFEFIQDAIDAAANGDIIELCDATFTGTGNRDLDFGGKCLTVRSQSGNRNACIIDCEHAGRGFYFRSGEECHAIVQGITITNGTEANGGGIYCENASPTIADCTIEDCDAYEFGGGIYSAWGSPTIDRCKVAGCGWTGTGGIYCEFDSPTITWCTVTGNDGGGMSFSFSDPLIIQCTVSGNRPGQAGGMSFYHSDTTVENSILWGDCGEEVWQYQSYTNFRCCDVEGGMPGEYNIDADPLFCCPQDCEDAPTSAGNYHLLAGSPCVSPDCGLIGALCYAGDLDDDMDVGQGDLGALLAAWCSHPGDPNWDQCADLDCDGHVGQSDLGILLSNWGKVCP